MRLHVACAVASSLAAFACQRPAVLPPRPIVPPPAPMAAAAGPVVRVAYACESGQAVTAAYPEADAAEIAYLGRAYPLRSDGADAGRFIGAGLEWRARGGETHESATLSRLGAGPAVGAVVLERCSRPYAGALGDDPEPEKEPPPPPPPPPPGPTRADAACSGAMLRLTSDQADALDAKRVAGFTLRNLGPRPCRLEGYPAIVLRDRAGGAVSGVRLEASEGGYFTRPGPPAAVALAPGGRAVFEVAWNVGPPTATSPACVSADAMSVTAPGDATPLALALPIAPCGGRLRVTPVRPASDLVAAS